VLEMDQKSIDVLINYPFLNEAIKYSILALEISTQSLIEACDDLQAREKLFVYIQKKVNNFMLKNSSSNFNHLLIDPETGKCQKERL
jgi:hypothetical protein